MSKDSSKSSRCKRVMVALRLVLEINSVCTELVFSHVDKLRLPETAIEMLRLPC